MDEQLQLLISLCEEEKIRLQKLIDECLAEQEYLMAHYHSNALYRVNSRIRTLHCFDDKYYDEKAFYQRMVNRTTEIIDSLGSDPMKGFYNEQLQEAKEKLEKLNRIPKQLSISETSGLLNEAFIKLVEGKIKNLRLIIKKKDNLLLAFSYSGKTLKVVLPYVKQHKKKWVLYDNQIKSLQTLGFEFDDRESRLGLTLKGNAEILDRLWTLLARISFEIFSVLGLDNESYIQFTDKTSQ